MRTGENIRRRADGRYEARYPKGRDAQGRLLYGSCYGQTYAEAAEKRRALLGASVREMNLLILGAGGHGEVVRDLAERLGIFRKIGFLDDDPANPRRMGPCEKLEQYLQEWPIAFPSVGEQEVRMRWLEQLALAGFVLPVLIHPTAAVAPTASVGYGTIVEVGATVGPGAKLGPGCIIASGATVDRNVVLPPGTLVDVGRMVTVAEVPALVGQDARRSI